MKNLLLLLLTLVTLTSFGQQNFILGKWSYEKIPDHLELDEESIKLSNQFFKDLSISFDSKNYQQIIMGKSETGTWSLLSDDLYKFSSSKGYDYDVEIKKINDNQIIFKFNNKEFQLLKTDEEVNIESHGNLIDKIEGVEINSKDLIGKWFYNGRIKDGKESDLILKHNKNEIANYTFKKNGEYINKAPFGLELFGIWDIKKDKKTLIIKSDGKSEFLKVTKLNETEIHLYNPKNDSIIKFKKKN